MFNLFTSVGGLVEFMHLQTDDYLFEELKYYNHFLLTQSLSQTNIHQILFAFVSISLKAAFKKTHQKINLGESFTVKCKM